MFFFLNFFHSFVRFNCDPPLDVSFLILLGILRGLLVHHCMLKFPVFSSMNGRLFLFVLNESSESFVWSGQPVFNYLNLILKSLIVIRIVELQQQLFNLCPLQYSLLTCVYIIFTITVVSQLFLCKLLGLLLRMNTDLKYSTLV